MISIFIKTHLSKVLIPIAIIHVSLAATTLWLVPFIADTAKIMLEKKTWHWLVKDNWVIHDCHLDTNACSQNKYNVIMIIKFNNELEIWKNAKYMENGKYIEIGKYMEIC